MDDVDAVQAQIARNMLQSGDWVTARLNGIAYLEKSPLGYWLTAMSYRAFGVHDWAARLPLSIAVVALCWLTLKFGTWALLGVSLGLGLLLKGLIAIVFPNGCRLRLYRSSIEASFGSTSSMSMSFDF
jgi:4-amino-4-deoxy-L-arabinose transferase-like glycosyltransferase